MDLSKKDTYCTKYTNEDIFAFSDVHGDFLALITYLQDCAKVIKLSDGVDYFQMLDKVKYDYKISKQPENQPSDDEYSSYTSTEPEENSPNYNTHIEKQKLRRSKKEEKSRAIKEQNYNPDYESILKQIIDDDSSKYDCLYGFEWCGNKSLVIITGDLIDNYRDGTVERTDRIINEEIKIILFLRKLARKAQEVGGNIITLYGNHEYYNVHERDNFPKWNNIYINPKSLNEEFVLGIKRDNFFKQDNFSFLLENFDYNKEFQNKEFGKRLAIYKVNDIIFMHGGMTDKVIELIYNKLVEKKSILSVDNFIIEINDIFNNVSDQDNDKYNDEKKILFEDVDSSLLWNRTLGGENNLNLSEYEAKLLNIFELLCSYNISDRSNMIFVIGHCSQYEYFIQTNRENSSHSQIDKSDNHHIIYGKIISTNIDFELSKNTNKPIIFGITTCCPMKCNPDIGQIYKIDISASRAFDSINVSTKLESEYDKISNLDQNTIDNFLIHILKKHYVSRLPQVIHFTFCKNKIISSKIRRALLSETLIRMERNNYFPFNKKGRELGLDSRSLSLLKDIDNFKL